MTNAEIIFSESCRLLKEGIITTTGRTILVEVIDGATGEPVTKSFDEPEQIHTFANWKAAGYTVKKGEKAIAAFPIWKYTAGKTKTDENGEEIQANGRMFLKVSHFFKRSQVEPIKA